MLTTLPLVFALLLSTAAGPPATPVPGEAAGVPIRVDRCHARPGIPTMYYYDIWGRYITQPGRQAALEVTYTNVTSKVAKMVDIGLVARKYLQAEVHDVGTFSPNIAIDHEFSIPNSSYPVGIPHIAQSCVILRVQFADGSKWVNPKPPPIT